MKASEIFDNIQRKIEDTLQQAPVADIKHNMRAMVHQGLNKLDIVTRAEFDVQTKVLAQTRAQLECLEAKLAELEAIIAAQNK